jgi:hypothetical protein
MNIYVIHTLRSDWYLADVCDYIFASLEGAKKWTAYYIENKTERDIYISTFEECQRLVEDNDMKPKAMLQALSDLHDTATAHRAPFFSMEKWFYDGVGIRKKAVETAFELVSGTLNRFLSP